MFFLHSITPAEVLLQALNRFLVLNPDVHLLPAPSLTHLTALYAVSHHASCSVFHTYNVDVYVLTFYHGCRHQCMTSQPSQLLHMQQVTVCYPQCMLHVSSVIVCVCVDRLSDSGESSAAGSQSWLCIHCHTSHAGVGLCPATTAQHCQNLGEYMGRYTASSDV